MRKNEKGFGAIGAVLVIVAVGVVGFAGWNIWHAKQKTSQKQNATTKSQITTVSSSKATKQNEEDVAVSQTAQNPPPAQQTVTAPSKAGTAYEIYRMASDGSSAQLSPVATTLRDVDSVELTIDLQCSGTCQFKLVSDTYSFSNTATYTAGQKIKYTITKPGEYILYNQFLPDTKFKITF